MIERIVCDGEVLIACILLLLLLLLLHHATFHVVVVVVVIVVVIWGEVVSSSSSPSSCGSSSSGEHVRAKRVQILFPDIIRLGNSILPSSISSVSSSSSNDSKGSLISSVHVPGDRHESVENDGSGERVEMDSFTCICGRQVGFEDG